LLATVLAGSLLSLAAHRRQLALADKRIAAVDFAEQLLAAKTPIPRPTSGAVPGQPNWYWQTAVIGSTRPMGRPMFVVRLSIIERKPDGTQRVLTSVDLVEPIS
jgi:hypothetical protein